MADPTPNQAMVEYKRRQLEKAFRKSSRSVIDHCDRRPSVWGRLKLWCVRWLTAGNAPRICRLPQGETYIWQVYVPIENRTLYFSREHDVRTWLDRYSSLESRRFAAENKYGNM